MNIADFPQMGKEARKKLHREMFKLGNPEHLRKETSFEDFVSRMKDGG